MTIAPGQDFESPDKQLKPEQRSGTDVRTEMLRKILSAFNHSGINYAVLHSEDMGLPRVDSDVDIVFDQHPGHTVEPLLINLQTQGHIIIIQKLHYEVPYGYYYILGSSEEVTPDTVLHLDCLYDPYGINRYFIPTTDLLVDRIREDWGFRVSDRNIALHLLIKRAIKGNSDQSRIAVIRRLFEPANETLDISIIEKWFGSKSSLLVAKLASEKNTAQADTLLHELKTKLLKQMWLRHPVLLLLSSFWSAIRKVGRLFRPAGTFVVFLGPDGCGKTTLSRSVEACHSRTYRRVWRFHWRPGLLPKLGQRKANKPDSAITVPPRKAIYGTLVSLIRYLYYLADFVLGYWLVVYPKKARSTLVIGERWYYDVIVNPARYGFNLPGWFLMLGRVLVPEPDRVFLLTAEPVTIHQRKTELEIDEIEEQIRLFRKILPVSPCGVEIANQGLADVALSKISKTITDCRSDATAELIAASMKTEWSGFGVGNSTKVWIHTSDPVENALKLYNPHSRTGLIAKYSARYIPRKAAQFCFFSSSPGHAELAKLASHSMLIRQTIGFNDAAISFTVGTAGPHQKYTAQVSRNGHVLSYVKIAPENIGELLENEACTLDRFKNSDLHVSVPQALHSRHVNGYIYLFISPPEGHTIRRGIVFDHYDRNFLLAMIPTKPCQVNPDRILSSCGPCCTGNSSPEQSKNAVWQDVEDQIRLMVKDGGVFVGRSHGDYAPWNTFLLSDGSLFVFDWEYSFEPAPLFFDLFHCLLMPDRLVRSLPAKDVVNRLLSFSSDSYSQAVYQRTGLCEKDFPAYLLLYLLIISRRKTADFSLLEFLGDCARMVLKHLGRPGYYRKILVSAYACEPDKGSEPGVGWNWVKMIARENEAWVITRANNRQSIEAHLKAHPNPRLHFEYVDLPVWLSFWKKGSRGIRTYYYLWQFAALKRAFCLFRTVRFDLGHHITFVNDWIWTFLALTPLPFVWGPIGSHPQIPAQLLPNKKNRIQDNFRYTFQAIMRLADPLFWLSTIRSKRILCINDQVAAHAPISWLADNKIIIEPAIAVEKMHTEKGYKKGKEFSALFVGRFVSMKGPLMALESFAAFAKEVNSARMTMIGSGHEYSALLDTIDSLGLKEQVTVVEWMPREKVLKLFSEYDVFLFPSMEGGGMVVLEAIASGIPVVCLDYGGPGSMVDDSTGIKIRVGSRSSIISGLTEALKLLHRRKEEEYPTVLNDKALTRYSWEYKLKVIKMAYSDTYESNKASDGVIGD